MRRVSRIAGLGLLAALALVATGCATWLGSVRKSLRDPGVHFRAFPEEVAREYACEEKQLPHFTIERLELLPNRLRPGQEFNHRLIYALCPRHPTGVVSGTLHTRILHRGRVIVNEQDPAYEFKPGRWIVDTFVTVPENARVGIYAMELQFEGEDLDFRESLTFAVDGERQQ